MSPPRPAVVAVVLGASDPERPVPTPARGDPHAVWGPPVNKAE